MQWRNQSHRPKPITVISILEFIPGIILVLFGVFMSFIVYMQIRMMSIFGGSPFSSFFGPIYILFLVMVIGYVALGILLAIVGRGLYRGKGWAWKYTVILEVASIAWNLLAPVLLLLLFSSNPGFNNPGFNNPGFNNPGFNNPGFNNPGFNNPGLGTHSDVFLSSLLQMILATIPYVVIAVIVLIYMRRPKTRAYFGKVQLNKG